MTTPPSQPRKEHYFIVEDDLGRHGYVLGQASYSIGRRKACDICLHSQFVSRLHATLLRCLRNDGNAYYRIVDGDGYSRSSSNGILINGHKQLSHDLKDGDEIVFGPNVFGIYQYRQRSSFQNSEDEDDPFDITLIDPKMLSTYGNDMDDTPTR